MNDKPVSSDSVIRSLRTQLSEAHFQIAVLTAHLEEALQGTMEEED